MNDESVNSSPSVAKLKQPAKSVLKMTRVSQWENWLLMTLDVRCEIISIVKMLHF